MNNLREIQALRKLAPHPNVVHLEEVLFDEPTGRLAMVFELMEANLYDLISGKFTFRSDLSFRNILKYKRSANNDVLTALSMQVAETT